MKKLMFSTGDKVGSFGIKYINDVCNQGSKKRSARFLCHCGVEFDCVISKVNRDSTKSCGCLKPKLIREARTTHGMRYSRLYEIWSGMKSRCGNPTNERYDRYGGRGITICKEWHDDFSGFLSWALNNGYDKSLQIDRINNDKGYEPDNCRFVTSMINNRNKSAPKNSLTGIAGVSWCNRDSRYKVRIGVDCGSSKFLGTFPDFFEACCARKSAENRYWR